jgi:hypothetical protein
LEAGPRHDGYHFCAGKVTLMTDRAEQREAAYRAVLNHLPAGNLSPESHRARARKLADAAIAAYEETLPEEYGPLPEQPDPFERTMPLPEEAKPQVPVAEVEKLYRRLPLEFCCEKAGYQFAPCGQCMGCGFRSLLSPSPSPTDRGNE